MRAYSPVSSNDDMGFFELVIKVRRPTSLPTALPVAGRPHDRWRRHSASLCSAARQPCGDVAAPKHPKLSPVPPKPLCAALPQVYSAGVDPKFPEGGKMSCHLDSLAIGDTIEAKGPMGHVTYLGRGK